VTFVENHDVVRAVPLLRQALAYAFILTHEGYPCVFWQDYFNWTSHSRTIKRHRCADQVHEQNAAGPPQVLFVDDDLYIMQRPGNANQSGLVFVLNNSGDWKRCVIQTRWNQHAVCSGCLARAPRLGTPQEKRTNDSGGLTSGRLPAAMRFISRSESQALHIDFPLLRGCGSDAQHFGVVKACRQRWRW